MMTQKPIVISQEQIRLGTYKSRDFAHPLWQIPREYVTGPWSAVASHLMWMGTSSIVKAIPKPSIDRDSALLHVGAVLHAVDMSVEHREAAASYLLGNWFETMVLSDNIAAGTGVHMTQGQGSLEMDLR